ncbi:TPA: hypothetical protein ACE8WU_001735, partial [Neisseria gonorrhoeae]
TYLPIWYRPKKYAVALGSSSTASGEYSYASGYNSVASGNKSYAAGYAFVASAEGSIVIGDSRQVKPEADQGVAVGSKATVKNKAKQRVVVGSEAKVNAERGIAIGKEAKAGGKTTNTLLDGPAYYADAIAVGYQRRGWQRWRHRFGKTSKSNEAKWNGTRRRIRSCR